MRLGMIYFYFPRDPFLQLVQSSVLALKEGLEELVERAIRGYPHLINLITEILMKKVHFL
jgi:hypothetical protein